MLLAANPEGEVAWQAYELMASGGGGSTVWVV